MSWCNKCSKIDCKFKNNCRYLSYKNGCNFCHCINVPKTTKKCYCGSIITNKKFSNCKDCYLKNKIKVNKLWLSKCVYCNTINECDDHKSIKYIKKKDNNIENIPDPLNRTTDNVVNDVINTIEMNSPIIDICNNEKGYPFEKNLPIIDIYDDEKGYPFEMNLPFEDNDILIENKIIDKKYVPIQDIRNVDDIIVDNNDNKMKIVEYTDKKIVIYFGKYSVSGAPKKWTIFSNKAGGRWLVKIERNGIDYKEYICSYKPSEEEIKKAIYFLVKNSRDTKLTLPTLPI
jgi:hypothetical protein